MEMQAPPRQQQNDDQQQQQKDLSSEAEAAIEMVEVKEDRQIEEDDDFGKGASSPGSTTMPAQAAAAAHALRESSQDERDGDQTSLKEALPDGSDNLIQDIENVLDKSGKAAPDETSDNFRRQASFASQVVGLPQTSSMGADATMKEDAAIKKLGTTSQNEQVSGLMLAENDFDEDDDEWIPKPLQQINPMMDYYHGANRPDTNQSNTAHEYLEKVMYKLPLHSLYEVYASCCYEENSDFCPVILKINNEDIMYMENGMKYLLQVWTINGELVFERPMHQPVSNWNISGDKFVFQEKPSDATVYLANLFVDQPAKLYKLDFDHSKVDGLTNTEFDRQSLRFVVPPDDVKGKTAHTLYKNDAALEQDDEGAKAANDSLAPLRVTQENLFKSPYKRSATRNKTQLASSKYGKISPEHQTDSEAKKTDDNESLTDHFDGQLTEHLPDRMIEFISPGYILLAYRERVIFLDVRDIEKPEFKVDRFFWEVKLKRHQVTSLDIRDSHKIICLQSLGSGETALVIEDYDTREIRFLKVFYSKSLKKIETEFKLVQLGGLINRKEKKISPLLKYRGVVKTDPITGVNYHVSIVLRRSGLFEVYSDFMLVNEYYDPNHQCVDIKTSFNRFFLLFAKKPSPETPISQLRHSDLEKELRHVKHSWRNRIGMNTSVISTKQSHGWARIIQSRVANHMRLYSHFITYSTYVLVSHRNLISVFKMEDGDLSKQSNNSGRQLEVVRMQSYIRQMFIVKKSKHQIELENRKARKMGDKSSSQRQSVAKQFSLAVFTDTNRVDYFRLGGDGRFVKSSNYKSDAGLRSKQTVKVPGRILKMVEDETQKFGVILLIDNCKEQQTFTEIRQFRFNTFSTSQVEDGESNSQMKFYALKKGVLFEMFAIDASLRECLDYDSDFRIIKASKDLFRVQKSEDEFEDDDSGQDDDDNKEFDELFGDDSSKLCTVFYCASQRNQIVKLFPIQRQKKNGTDDFTLLTNEKYVRSVDIDDDSAPILEVFVTSSSENQERPNNLVLISQTSIGVYERGKRDPTQMNFVMSIMGLNIRGVKQISESYLYVICDEISQPFVVNKVDEDFRPQANFKATNPGFFVLDIQRLLQGKVEKYKIAQAIGGQCSIVQKNMFTDRFTVLNNYDQISVIPFPHLNKMDCYGMKSKHEYLIWRQKNGFFTALSRGGQLTTWSLITGKSLYSNGSGFRPRQLHNYDIYQADPNDITYIQDFYNFENVSYTLLKSCEPVSLHDEEQKEKLVLDQSINKSHLDKKLLKLQTKLKIAVKNISKGQNQLPEDLFKTSDPSIKTQLVNSEQQTDIYHFKVLSLQTIEDDAGLTQPCKLKFHFLHKMIRSLDSLAIESKDSWNVNENPVQRLYLSQDTKKMMEVINDTVARVYTRRYIDEHGKSFVGEGDESAYEGRQVTWKESYIITRFPRSLVQQTSVPYLFSPNFTYQFDFSFIKRQFVIKETATRQVYMYIPEDLLSTALNQVHSEASIIIICSRVSWVSERQLRILNSGDIDCIFEMCSTDKTDKDQKKRYLKLVSASKIDNLHVNKTRIDVPHVHKHRTPLETDDVLGRLIRTNQLYKTELQHALNMGRKEFSILNLINRVDYLQPYYDYKSSFNVETSFTLLDWLIIETVCKDSSFQLEKIDDEQKMQLCFNILPQGHGILHKLAENCNSTDEKHSDAKQKEQLGGDQMTSYYATRELFETANKKSDFNIEGAIDGCSFEIPILHNWNGFTVVDICLGSRDNKLTRHPFFQNESQSNNIFNSKLKRINLVMAEEIFKYIIDYSMMHSSFQLVNAVTLATEMSLPYIKEYLESRLMKPSFAFTSSTQHMLRKSNTHRNPSMGEYGLLPVPIWGPENKTQKAMFDSSGPLQPTNLKLLDLPLVFKCPTQDGFEFIEALVKVEDLDTFSLKSIQIIIDAHAAYWDKINILAIGLPMTFQLVAFSYWSNILLPIISLGEEHIETQVSVLKVIMVATAVYLLLIETSVIYKRRLAYLQTSSKLFNLITPLLIMFNVFKNNTEETSFWTIQSWSAVAIWVRFLLFLRSINTFSWLIRMIVKCLTDMVIFLSVCFFAITGFADAFQSIDKILEIKGFVDPTKLSDNPSFFEKYMQGYMNAWQKSFLTAIGEFDGNLEHYREGDFLIFSICVVFNIILLLNLLIAIISETYTNISSISVQTTYKEKAYQIHSVQESLFGFKRLAPAATELLFIAKTIDNEDILDSSNRMDDIQESIEEMESNLTDLIEQKFLILAFQVNQKMNGDSSSNDDDMQQTQRFTSQRLTHAVSSTKDAADSVAKRFMGDRTTGLSTIPEKNEDTPPPSDSKAGSSPKKQESKDNSSGSRKFKASVSLMTDSSDEQDEPVVPKRKVRISRQSTKPSEFFNEYKRQESNILSSIFGEENDYTPAPKSMSKSKMSKSKVSASPMKWMSKQRESRAPMQSFTSQIQQPSDSSSKSISLSINRQHLPSHQMDQSMSPQRASGHTDINTIREKFLNQQSQSTRIVYASKSRSSYKQEIGDETMSPQIQIQAPIQRDFSKDIQESRSKSRKTSKKSSSYIR